MKKISFLTLGFIFSASAFAQIREFNQSGFHAGITGSFNSVWIINQNTYGAKELEYRPKYGFAYGAEIGYNITRHLGIQLEGFYSQQGQNYYDVLSDGGKINRQVDLTYSYTALMFKYIGGKTASFTQFYWLIGPQFGKKLTSGIQYNKKEFLPWDVNKDGVTDNQFFGKSDWGLAMGIGADIRLAKFLYLNAGLRLYYGFQDINAAPYRIAPSQFKPYEQSTNAFGGINLGVHYLLHRSKSNQPKFN